MKEQFYLEFGLKKDVRNINSVSLDHLRYGELVEKVKKLKNEELKKKTNDYRLLKRYDVMSIGGDWRLIQPVKEGDSTVRYYITDEELFDKVHETHLEIGHGGRDRMLKEICSKYANITRNDILLYLQLCVSCQKKQKGIKKEMTDEGTEGLKKRFKHLNKEELHRKVSEGVYNIVIDPKINRRSAVWKVFGQVKDENDKIIEGYVGCRKCYCIRLYNGKQTTSLLKHTCIKKGFHHPGRCCFKRIDGIVHGGIPSSQPSTAAEKPDEQTSRAESDIAPPSTNKAVGMKVPASTHTSTEHAERYSKLKKSKSIRKCTETVSMKNVRVKNFIKSYGTAILTGIDALPPDVAIEFSVNVLKELNKKVLETSLKEDENDNESVYSLCSATEEDENDEPDDSDSDVEMDANSTGGVTHKDNETSNRFLDTTIKIESDVSVDNAHNP